MGDPQLIKRMVSGDFPEESKPTHKDSISEKFFEKVDESGVDFDKLLKTSENDVGRVYLFKKYFEWIPYCQDELNQYKKNSITSSRLLEKGRKCRSEKNNKEALIYYNLAIAYAPIPFRSSGAGNDEEAISAFFVGLSERSDLLLSVRGGEEALRDINYAMDLLENKQGDLATSLKAELEERKTKCLKFLAEKQSFMLELARDSLEEQEKRSKYRNVLLFRIKQPNPSIPCAEDFVDIRVDNEKGRQLIVTRDIPPGTTMVVEEPFVKVLKSSFKWDMNHCHFCFRKIRGGGGIPCPGCVFEIYCSPECVRGAYKRYHKYECPCYPYFHNNRTQRHIHMALRIVCTVGPQEMYRMFKLKDPKLFSPPTTGNPSLPAFVLGKDPDTNMYDSSSYLPIYHLIAHQHNPDDIGDIEYFTNVLQGLIFANALEKFSSFYDEISYLNTHPKEFFKTFVASIILHHIENVAYNSISLDELTGLEGITLLVKEPTILNERIRGIQFPQYGAATYGLASLINHSCEPNTTRVHDMTHGRMAFVALKGIKAGEELVTSYSRIFLADTRDERREYLKKTYNFFCTCIACNQDWPPLLQITENLQFSCSACAKKFRMDEKFGPNYTKCILDKKGKCLSCKKSYQLGEVQDQLESKIESFFKAYDFILKNKPLEAIRLIAPCIQHFQDNVVPPYRKLYMAQDLLKSALDLIVYYSEAK